MTKSYKWMFVMLAITLFLFSFLSTLAAMSFWIVGLVEFRFVLRILQVLTCFWSVVFFAAGIWAVYKLWSIRR